VGIPGLGLCAAPCRDNIISFILFCMSEVKLLARGGGGPGLRAALTGPRGDEVEFMVGAEPIAEDLRVGGLGDVDVSGPSAGSELVEVSESGVVTASGAIGCSWSAMFRLGRWAD